MKLKEKIEDILLNDFGSFDDYTVEKLLNLHSVSQQREQLIDFSMKRNKAPKEFRPQYEKEVDEYLKSINCG